MALDRDLLRRIRALDEHDLRRLLIFARGLLVTRHGLDQEKWTQRGRITYRQ